MTPAERDLEWLVAHMTAIGRSCGEQEPTEQQIADATVEADEWVRRCEAEETNGHLSGTA